MEFHEKLQELRKHKGLTQEELAAYLYVSRTAISKWESGRGYPNIESLKAISKFFSITIDDLLSCDEVLSIAEEIQKQQKLHMQDLVYGFSDISIAIFCSLPIFGQKTNGIIHTASLFSLTGIQPYLHATYWMFVICITVSGILTLALKNCRQTLWLQYKGKLSLLFSITGIFLFTISMQPYAAAILFIFLIIKTFLLIKWQ